MQIILFFIFAIVSSAFAAPRERRSTFNSFNPYSGVGGFSYAGPGVGVYTGTGVGGGFWPPFFGFPVFNPWSIFQPVTPWYEGPNVCPKTKVIDESPNEEDEWFKDGDFYGDLEHSSKSCRGDNNKYSCMERVTTNGVSKLVLTKYECCLGFVRNPSGPGCIEKTDAQTPSDDVTEVSTTRSQSESDRPLRKSDKLRYRNVSSKSGATIDLRYLMPTLRNMGASELVKAVEIVGMAENFHNNNYTVFCPPNSVIEAFKKDLEEEIDNEVLVKVNHSKLKNKSQLHSMLLSHLCPGFLKIDDFYDNYVEHTENPQSDIRFNVYFTPEKVVTANCVPILSGDYFARNGMIHVVEKLLPTPTRTVADIIAGDFQFSILKGMLSMAGLVQTLRNPNGSYTMFAPTDSALKSALSTQDGESDSRCAVSVMKHHIIDHVVCSAALLHQARSLNMIGELLSLTRDSHNKLYVDGVQIVVRDLMATNGVVHIIDGMLSTRQTKSISRVLKESGLSEFLSLIDEANLRSEFDSMENVTFFIPSNEVIKGIKLKHVKSFLSHNESVLDVLRFHVVESQTELVSPGQLLQSKLENATLRFQIHLMYPQMTPQIMVQCASVLSADIKLCGGTLHVIDKLLLPPRITIVDFLESVEGFSTLVLLLRATGLDRRLRSNGQFAYTLLAPTDDAFHQMGDEALFRILENISKTTDLVKTHIILGSVCCTQLKNDLMSGRRQARMMDGSLLPLDRSTDGVLTVGGAHVVDCDIVAANGVIHIVDAVVSHHPISFLGGGYLDNLFMLI